LDSLELVGMEKKDLFRLMQVTRVNLVCLCHVDKYQLNEAADLVQSRDPSKKRPQI
tara:strand:+ start:141 stop:308 length:168 start_codon:yes stop_codon:yes gene_type:complete